MIGDSFPPCYIPPFVEPTMGHVDMTPFRQIISDWFDQREVAEGSPVWCMLTDEEKATSRQFSFLGKVKPVRWMLKQMAQVNHKSFDDAILMWLETDMRYVEGKFPRLVREHSLYLLIEDYFAGQGFKTRS